MCLLQNLVADPFAVTSWLQNLVANSFAATDLLRDLVANRFALIWGGTPKYLKKQKLFCKKKHIFANRFAT